MAELEKETSSTAPVKERTSSLGGEIGSEFLGSWKSTTAGIDSFDFSETSPKEKGKSFKFDKVDMDFGLGSGFDKISSFKVDMSDLDFSSPPRKIELEKGKPVKQSALRRQEGISDEFTFNFDFNELDGFDFDSPNAGKKESEIKGDKGPCSSEKCAKDHDCASNLATSINISSVSQSDMLHLSEENNTPKFGPQKGIGAVTNDAQSIFENLGNQDGINDAIPSLKRMCVFGKGSKTEFHQEQSYSSRPTKASAIQDVTVQHLSINGSVSETQAELQKKGVLQANLTDSNKETNNNPSVEVDDSMTSVDSLKSTDSGASSNLECSPPPCLIVSKEHDSKFQKSLEADSHASKESNIMVDSALTNKSFGDGAKFHKAVTTENSCSFYNGLLKLQGKSTEDKEGTTKAKSSGVVQSKYLSNLDDSKSRLLLASSPSNVSSGKRESGRMHLGPVNVKRKILGGLEKEAQGKNDVSDCNKASTKAPAALERDKNDKELTISMRSSSKFTLPNMDLKKHSKIIPVEKQATTPWTSNKLSDFSSLNKMSALTSKSESSSVSFEKEITMIKQRGKKFEMRQNTASKAAPFVFEENTALISSFKRKASEWPCLEPVNSNPLKRSMEAEPEGRNVQEASPKIEGKMILHIDDSGGSYLSVPYGNSTSTTDVPLGACMAEVEDATLKESDVNMAEVERATLTESDVNVEKAESCAKELEALCNMLKRKQDEAKELLVRAIVNRNLLLLLNHPSYEEKILTIQKNAANIYKKS